MRIRQKIDGSAARLSLLLLAVALVAACATPRSNGGEPDVVVTSESDGPVRGAIIPEGTSLWLTLDQELGVEKNRRGDSFSATVSEPVLEAGRVVVPAGAKVHGHVTALQDADDPEYEVDVIKLHFTRLEFDGESYPLDVELVEANPEMKSTQGTGETVAKIAAGTAVGALLGRIIGGDDEGALVGAAVGAAAGTAIVLGTAEEKAVLPEGSRLRVRTRSSMRVLA